MHNIFLVSSELPDDILGLSAKFRVVGSRLRACGANLG
jgi:hypothetical protein